MLASINEGIGFLRQGFNVGRSRSVRVWLILPVLANSVLFSLAWYWSAGWLTDLLQGWTGAWQFSGFFEFVNPVIDFLRSVIKWLIWLLMLVLLASVFTTVVQLISAPFMGFLSAKVDELYAIEPLPEEGWWAMSKRVVWRELIKLYYWSWRALLVFVGTALLSFFLAAIPVVNLIGPGIWFLWASWMMGIQYMDYGADNRIIPFKQALGRFREHRWLVIGFGGVVLMFTMVPLVNLFIMPVAVIGGTLAWLYIGGFAAPNADVFPKRLLSVASEPVNLPPRKTGVRQTHE